MTKVKIFSSIIVPPVLLFNTAVLGDLTVFQNQKNDTAKYQMVDQIESKKVNREEVLENFFDKYDSPLKEHSETFVEVADLYGIDFRILPAISCIESSCGKFMPSNSFNAFGWGVYGNSAIRFESYDDAIFTVGEGLNKNYFEKGLDTLEEIAPVYTPPQHVHWLGSVKYFVNEMDKVEENLHSNAISYNTEL